MSFPIDLRMIQGRDCMYPCPSKESVQAVIDAYNYFTENHSYDSEVIVSEALWQCWEETDRKGWMWEVAALWFGWNIKSQPDTVLTNEYGIGFAIAKDDVYPTMYEICVKHTDLSPTEVKRDLIKDILEGKYS